jgi:hypothetical protein
VIVWGALKGIGIMLEEARFDTEGTAQLRRRAEHRPAWSCYTGIRLVAIF